MKLTDRLEELWGDFQLEHTYNTLEAQQANRKRSKQIVAQAIAKDIRELLPKQKEPQNSEPDTPQRLINRGYNKAILDMEEALKEYLK